MLLTGWIKEITRAECRPDAQTVHCIARLDQPIGAAIPYLNAVLGGYIYCKEPPSVTFRSQGKLITVHDDHIAIVTVHQKQGMRSLPHNCNRLPGASDARKRPAMCASAHEQAADKADGVHGERLRIIEHLTPPGDTNVIANISPIPAEDQAGFCRRFGNCLPFFQCLEHI